MDELISRILDTVKATAYNIYLSCGRADSFRAKLNPEYKANRIQPKPLHYQLLKDHLITKWNAVVAVEEEADDLIGIEQQKDIHCRLLLEEAPDTIACTIDKDILFGVPGNKYNFVKEEMFYTTEQQALVFFYKQLLMGDKADNILGITGIGTAKADKILSDYHDANESILYTIVVDMYRSWLEQEWADQYDVWTSNEEKRMLDLIHLSGKQLKIRSYEGEIWQPPYGQVDV
jgi:5'-3' exonuclease